MPSDGSDRFDADRVPPRAPWRWRPLVGVLAAIAVAAALLAIAWRLDRDGTRRDRHRIDPEVVIDLVEPDPLTDEERNRLDGRGDRSAASGPASVALSEGGWIEVADDAGRLKQRYAAARMDPLPDGWVEMLEPRALVFGRGGRVTALEGRFGTARLPEREIESGTLREEVRVRFYRPDGERPVSPERDDPWLVIEAEHADYDGAEGRIRCDGPVSITSPELEFSGENVLVLLGPEGRDIEQLVVERATTPLLLRPRSTSRTDARPETASNAEIGSDTSEPDAPDPSAAGAPTSSPQADRPTFMRLVLDGGVAVLRDDGDRRLRIEGDRLAAVFAMEAGGGDRRSAASPPIESRPLPATTWLAANAMTDATGRRAVDAPEASASTFVEIEFGGSLLVEPVDPGVATPSSKDEVWVRVEGRDVRIHDESRDARIRCDVLEARSGGPAGDRVDLLATRGLVEIDAPGLGMQAPAVRVRGTRVLVAGPGDLILEPASSTSDAGSGGSASPSDPVEIAWADRLDLTLSETEERLRRARFEGGETGGVRVRSDALVLDAGTLDVSFLEQGERESGGERIDRVVAEGRVVAGRPDGSGRIETSRLLVEMRQDPDASRPGRLEAIGEVRAFDAERVLWASTLDVVMRPSADPEFPDSPPSDRGGSGLGSGTMRGDIDSVEARGAVVAGLADGTWIFADAFTTRPAEGQLALEGDDVAIVRDGTILDGLRGLSLLETEDRIEARTGGPGRLQASPQPLHAAWIAPAPEDLDSWSWPTPPDRPRAPVDPTLAAVWEGGLRYLEARAEATPGSEVATLEVFDRVKARAIDEDRTEDRLAGTSLRVGFVRGPGSAGSAGERSSTPEEPASSRFGDVGAPGDSEGADSVLEIASLDLEGSASLERRRWSAEAGDAARPDLLRIAGDRIAYVVATGEGRVPGAGTLLVSEAERSTREARTARFRWTERLDLTRLGESDSAVAISGEVELAFAGGVAGPAFTLTADRMDAVLRPSSPGDAPDGEAAGGGVATPNPENLELRRVAGAGRVFVRGRGRDVECDAFDYDADTGMLVLSARPGRSVSVMTTTAAAPIRAERVRWNLRTDRVEIESARGEG